ncbi:hypothetical protein BCR36DRAFT_396939 [Piromyces finnis]|uniref:CBM21 domain-containing protein n=1 Tax=Piromyces finnis TaxID=1754191 RepID=A0A1Y1VBR8_9FUNG|nr:hypothetical protein BCR36DRAFT_396939 [Piromyces finnis]|eukprot:ORX52139.1 hypothetical protein BCR36DRAFT_396939 [Piromyces finnis]
MFNNNFPKSGTISILNKSNSISYDISYGSLENSNIENLKSLNFDNSFKSQLEKKIANENTRRKDSAIELEDIKNSLSDSENQLKENFENDKNINHINNQKIKYNTEDNNSEDENHIINTHEQEDIFDLEIDQNKNYPSITINNTVDQQNSISSSNPYLIQSFNQYYSVKNKNHLVNQSPKNSLIRGTLNITPTTNKNSNQHQKLSFRKIISHHFNDPTKIIEKSKVNYAKNEIKNSPTKYNGHDILKPILKKHYTQSNHIGKASTTSKELVYTKKITSSLKAYKNHSQRKKSVHFKSENEECPFKKFECPSNIVNLPIYIVDSILEPFMEAKLIKLKGFPSQKKVELPWDKNVILESIGLIDDETQEHDILRITIQVRNLAFEKIVKVHLTFNNWETKEIKEAKYHNTAKDDCNQNIDKFILDVDTDCDGESVCNLQFAIQYLVDHQEFWDNNNSKNYSIKVDRTVRIPAKEIKSHPCCDGPVVKYKLKPGYHYPLFKSNLREHPSADIPKETTNVSEFNNKFIDSSSKDDCKTKDTASINSAVPAVTRVSVERNTLTNLLDSDSISDGEETKKSKEYFSWNEPIMLRKPNTQKSTTGKSTNIINYSTSSFVEKEAMKSKDYSSSPIQFRSSYENSFQFPKHENWFKEAPSCNLSEFSPKKLYHHSSKWFDSSSPSSSPSSSFYQGKNTLKKEREEEEELKKRLNSKYAAFSPHLSSSSSRYMRNNLYGCSNDQAVYHLYSQPLIPTTTSNENLIQGKDDYHNTTNFTANTKNSNQSNNTTKGYSTNSNIIQYKGYGMNVNSHLYATQEDFISDRLSYY